MSFSDWIVETGENFRRYSPTEAVRRSGGQFFHGVGRRLVTRGINYGTPHWDRGDWDVLVILDACRFDLMQEVAVEYDWLPKVRRHYSPASMSPQWLEQMTRPKYLDEMAETALISANPFTRENFVRADEWSGLDDVWRYAWDDTHGTVLPRDVTDATIRQHRSQNHGRLIAWYLQPHIPFVGSDWSEGFDSTEIFGRDGGEDMDRGMWDRFDDGAISFEELWQGYRENLKFVLDDVRLLLENVDGRVVISSDHGNAIGEWGIVGHPRYSVVPALRRVPWIELLASDEQTHSPESASASIDPVDVEERLKALGYKE